MSIFTRNLLNNYKIAIPIIAGIGSAYYLSTMSNSTIIKNESPKAFTGNGEWIDLKLKSSKDLSSNTKEFIFELPSKDQISGLITASCLLTKFVTPKGSNVIRPYTPISDVNDKGELQLLIKKYDGGKMSSHIFELKENDTLSFKGPILKWKWEENQFKEITLIGGGTGITPLYQLIHEILKNPNDKTKINLLYGSTSPDDILLKSELDSLSKSHPKQFTIDYFVDKSNESQKFDGKIGYITETDLKHRLSGPSDDTHVYICGPPPLYKAISGSKVSPSDQGEVTGILANLGYTKDHVFKF
ncbi:hypothetical protein B5S28_g4433 [[Candida] boidinii]|uniref:Unnamed protein product n=1 Tax=Candida boidinii TaxID=5477 RepID=A0ACB5TK37_CANBO|nr:hypothetical protein B5S28_g4433 [[Candida] boidinii]OWB73917.1 hypothetical protein B5S31_g3685 [[Candida] boidinii]OWB76120.1 hypothetical protein B5S32_g269 [[Candida] boidinii]GME89706.1 unnamed protein product [[Candida] boidinii]GMF08999.1 unnamed protein product [[Candida] boidinii]